MLFLMVIIYICDKSFMVMEIQRIISRFLGFELILFLKATMSASYFFQNVLFAIFCTRVSFAPRPSVIFFTLYIEQLPVLFSAFSSFSCSYLLSISDKILCLSCKSKILSFSLGNLKNQFLFTFSFAFPASSSIFFSSFTLNFAY